MKATHATYRIDVVYSEKSLDDGDLIGTMDNKMASIARELEFLCIGVKATKGLERKILLGQSVHKLDSYDEADMIINDSIKEAQAIVWKEE